MKVNESYRKLMKVNESYDIPWCFLCKITNFCSVMFNCNALLAFHDFVLWQTKFFCLLLYRFAFRWHRQIFCYCQTKGNSSNIADTYSALKPLNRTFPNSLTSVTPFRDKRSSLFCQSIHGLERSLCGLVIICSAKEK
jgi:hypothetical protein